jgi:hypothetical protein
MEIKRTTLICCPFSAVYQRSARVIDNCGGWWKTQQDLNLNSGLPDLMKGKPGGQLADKKPFNFTVGFGKHKYIHIHIA